MRFLFFTKTPKHNGTHRLFFQYLSRDMNERGHETVVADPLSAEITHADVIIVKPGEVNIAEVRERFADVLVGVVHPTDYTEQLFADTKSGDFYICGSLEERDYYLKYNPNIFVLPHIENEWPVSKCHFQRDTVTLGYHGNLHHLEQFLGRAEPAINALAQKFQLNLKAIYNTKLGDWAIGRPNVPVTVVPWNLETLAHELIDVDIGLVPATSPITEAERLAIVKQLSGSKAGSLGGFDNDYVLRFKNSTNAGRAFVFMQLGIPVVADFCPEMCSVIQHGESGYLAHSAHGWFDSLSELAASAELRKKTAEEARTFFSTNYNRDEHVKRFDIFVSKLLRLKKDGSLAKRPCFDADADYVPQVSVLRPSDSIEKLKKLGSRLGSKIGFHSK